MRDPAQRDRIDPSDPPPEVAEVLFMVACALAALPPLLVILLA